jgi:hypothetical protein
MYNQDPRALSGLSALDIPLANQVNSQILASPSDWFDFNFVDTTRDKNRPEWNQGVKRINSLALFQVVINYSAAMMKTDGSFQNTCKWLKDSGFITSAKADKWLGYWNNYWTLVWYKEHPGQQPPPGGVPTPKITQGNILEQLIAWLKGQGTSGTTTTPTTTNAGFLGTYGIPIIVLVGGIAILGFAFAPKKGGAPATVPLVKPTIRYRYRAKRRR